MMVSRSGPAYTTSSVMRGSFSHSEAAGGVEGAPAGGCCCATAGNDRPITATRIHLVNDKAILLNWSDRTIAECKLEREGVLSASITGPNPNDVAATSPMVSSHCVAEAAMPIALSKRNDERTLVQMSSSVAASR